MILALQRVKINTVLETLRFSVAYFRVRRKNAVTFRRILPTRQTRICVR